MPICARLLPACWTTAGIEGKEDAAFEAAFADYCGAKYCVGCGNGLDALVLILKALGIGPGDEVIVPSNTFIATVLAISYAGATPVFVEPVLASYNIDPTRAAAQAVWAMPPGSAFTLAKTWAPWAMPVA